MVTPDKHAGMFHAFIQLRTTKTPCQQRNFAKNDTEAPHEGRKGRMWHRFVFMIRDRKVFGPLEYALIIAIVATALVSTVSYFGNG